MAECVAHAQQIQHAAVVDDVDRARMDHAQGRHRPAVLGEDRGTGQEELDLGLRGQLSELLGAERVERRPRGQEARDFTQRRVQRDLHTLEVACDLQAVVQSKFIQILRLRQEAEALSPLHGLGPVANAQLAVHRAGVLLDRVLGQMQLLGDLRVGRPRGHQIQDVAFAL